MLMRKTLLLFACLPAAFLESLPARPAAKRNLAAAEPKAPAPVLESKGYIVAAHPVQVSADVSGRIIKLHFEEGTVVKAGDILAEFDSTRYRLDYEHARAKMEAARALYEELTSRQEVRKGRVAVAKAELAAAEARVLKAKHFLDQTKVRAPISGTVLTKFAEAGNHVDPRAFNLKGSLCDIADLADLEVELTIQERDLAKVFKGQRCRIRPEAYPGRVYHGAVSRLMPVADRGKGALPVRVKVNVPKGEEGQYLRPEMSVIVSVQASDAK